MREQQTDPLAHMPTGISGFDEITGGGLPRQGVTVVLGNAGAGKTVFELTLAETTARLRTLAKELTFQEAELEQIKANVAIEAEDRSGEDDELLLRRRAAQ
jgi:circadian clock protein KaiC